MKPPTLLSLLLSTTIPSVAAKCYKPASGAAWGRQGQLEAQYFVRDACYNNGGMFTGYYEPGQTKSMCPRGSNNIGFLFEVQNLNDHEGFDLGDDDCFSRLRENIACIGGGESTVAGWRFRADPGNC